MITTATRTLRSSRIRDLVHAARVHQWIKNLIIPIVGVIMFRPDIELGQATSHLILTFIAFCIAASSIYVFNDMMDIAKDLSHPIKCRRPIASGRLSTHVLIGGLLVTIPSALMLAWQVGPNVAALLGAYLAINLGYCVKFKHVAQLELVCVSSGFTIRALAGAFAVGRTVDFWLLAAVTFACMGMALMKRMKELKTLGTEAQTRPVLARYDYETLLRAHDMFMVLAVLSVTIFLEHSTKAMNNPVTVAVCLTFISGLFLVFIHRVQKDSDGDPTALIYRNKYLAMSAVMLVLAFSLLVRGMPA
jgi:decaprenyl-phosphate phosphoribosyltransferase